MRIKVCIIRSTFIQEKIERTALEETENATKNISIYFFFLVFILRIFFFANNFICF